MGMNGVPTAATPLIADQKSAMRCAAHPREFPRPVDTALKPVRVCTTVVSSRYSAWRVYPALWIPAYAGMTVRGIWTMLCIVFTLTLVLIPSRERGYLVGCFVLLYAQPLPLWIADQVRNDGVVVAVSRSVNTALKPV